ncbi:MAG: adenosyl-hopene transferase HpnH, partial [Phycisphaeraceae bacterium]
ETATAAISNAVKQGFRVTTNTTLFDGADPNSVRKFFDEMMDIGVEGMMLSPGYAYPKAPDQQSFMTERKNTTDFFDMVLSNRKKKWKFNLSPLYMEFLMGKRDYECTPWGSPTYNIFGWQKPCYLLQDGYVDTFNELIETTDWDAYGRASGNPSCQQCMVHCGYEPSAVNHTFAGFNGIWANAKPILFNSYANPAAKQKLKEEAKKPHGPLAQLSNVTIDGKPVVDEKDKQHEAA